MSSTAPDPAAAGFDPVRLRRAAEILEEGVREGLYPGGTVWVSRRGKDALVHSAGSTEFGGSVEADEHTLFDLASVTKPVATGSAMLLLAQEGRLHFGEPVTDFFSDRKLPHLAGVTLRHLLTHTSGLPAWRDLYSRGQTRDGAIDELFAIPPDNPPGTRHVYSCLGYIMLHLVAQEVSGQKFDAFCRERVFEPMGMRATMFNPPADGRAIAATDHCPARKRKLVGEVHDGNAWALGGVSGNAGLFSTAADLAVFCRSITSGATDGASGPLGPAALRKAFENALHPSVGGQSIGWFTASNDMLPAGDLASGEAVGHSGFTGTAVVIDPSYELFAILLTNRVCRDDDGLRFRHLRRRLFNAVIGSIVC